MTRFNFVIYGALEIISLRDEVDKDKENGAKTYLQHLMPNSGYIEQIKVYLTEVK